MSRAKWSGVVLFAIVALAADAAEITVRAPNSDYLIQIDKVLVPALAAALDKHHVTATVTFSFILGQKGHQSSIEVTSTPRDRGAEEMIARTICRLRLPFSPSGRMGPRDVVRIKNTLRPKP
jgi:hypothetical protein